VTVATQPNGQTCTVTGGFGGVVAANVSTISVTCAANIYTIGGTVSGLTAGTTLALQNGVDTLNLTINTAFFTFATPITHGGAYNVTVLSQPVGQTCSVSGLLGSASGTATANISTISVSCVTNTYTISGSVGGATGSVVLQDNGGDNLTLAANGNFTFATKIAHGGAYNVTVLTPPAGQTCTVTSPTGTATANVTNVSVSCATNAAPTYTIGGAVSGLTGTVVLQDNGGDNKTVATNGNYTFATLVTGAYSVTVLTQPAGQTCTVTSGSGTAAANVSNVAVSCTNNAAPTYTIGGAVSGLTGTLVLQDNGGDNKTITANAPFTFVTAVTGAYSVTVLTQPAGQTCTVTSGGGTASANVTTVAVSCVNTVVTYVVNVTAASLASTSVELQNNGGDNLIVYGTGFAAPFTFATPIASGGAYNVTVLTQPTNGQTCSVISGSGTSTTDVTITISCL
jgi:hypothetical protein